MKLTDEQFMELLELLQKYELNETNALSIRLFVERLITEAVEEAEKRMGCGHPKACLVDLETEAPDGSIQVYAEECCACRDIKETERIHDESMDLANKERDETVREAQVVTVERCVQTLRQDWLYKLADSREQTLEWARGELYKISPDPNFLARKMAEARLEETRWWERMAVQSHVGGLYRRRIDGLERQLKKFSRSKDS